MAKRYPTEDTFLGISIWSSFWFWLTPTCFILSAMFALIAVVCFHYGI